MSGVPVVFDVRIRSTNSGAVEMKRAFVVGRRQGGKTMLVLLDATAEVIPGPWTVAAVVSC